MGVKLYRIDNNDHKGMDHGVKEKVPCDYFCTTRRFERQGIGRLKDVIEWSSGEKTGDEAYEEAFDIEDGRRSDSKQYPLWVDVIVERGAFEAWLPIWLSEWKSEIG